jgi:F-type H+-transporting ATPase subunit gamma
MPSTKDIQRRIKSIGNTKKITKAMEMVAAAKMRKAIEEVLRTRTYANLSWETVLNLSKVAKQNREHSHPLLRKRKVINKVGIILITSNRGLCGGYNSAIIEKVHESIKKHQENKDIATDFIILGKKGEVVYKYFGYNIAAEFPKADIINQVSEITPLSQMVINEYLSGKYDKIMVAYTDFVSPMKQIPRVKQLLPVDISAHDKYLGIVGKNEHLGTNKKFIAEKEAKHLRDEKFIYEYTFEPSPREVLNEIVPRLVEVQLYQAILEANASEHSARMASMRQATDAANDMVDELTLYYNKARQSSITAEIAEITAGVNALK